MERENYKTKYPSWLASTSVLLLYVGIIVFGAIFYKQLGDIDEKLEYTPPVAAEQANLARIIPLTAGAVYLPVYSHIYSNNAAPVPLETTLSLRNTDPDGSIVVYYLKYVNSQGKKLEQLNELPIVIAPMASAEVLISKADVRGGTGANVVIKWKSEMQVNQPLFESVMVASSEDNSFAFTSRGVAIEPDR